VSITGQSTITVALNHYQRRNNSKQPKSQAVVSAVSKRDGLVSELKANVSMTTGLFTPSVVKSTPLKIPHLRYYQLNALQDAGLISDLVINPADIAHADYPKVLQWLKEHET